MSARKTKADIQAAFRNIQEAAAFAVGKDEWRAEVDNIALSLTASKLNREVTLKDITPATWLKAAKMATVTCPKCHGSGEYHWGGTLNGKPVHTGNCFACNGAGRQNMDDFYRNRAYWRRAIVRAAS